MQEDKVAFAEKVTRQFSTSGVVVGVAEQLLVMDDAHWHAYQKELMEAAVTPADNVLPNEADGNLSENVVAFIFISLFFTLTLVQKM